MGSSKNDLTITSKKERNIKFHRVPAKCFKTLKIKYMNYESPLNIYAIVERKIQTTSRHNDTTDENTGSYKYKEQTYLMLKCQQYKTFQQIIY